MSALLKVMKCGIRVSSIINIPDMYIYPVPVQAALEHRSVCAEFKRETKVKDILKISMHVSYLFSTMHVRLSTKMRKEARCLTS